MWHFTPKKIAIFASALGVFLLILFLNLMKVRDNGVTGRVIVESATDKAGMIGLFMMIALLVGVLTFITIIYKQNNRY
jgi:hypothetical protein